MSGAAGSRGHLSRRLTLTPAERTLWRELSDEPGGFTFWRSHRIRDWLVFVYAPAGHLVIAVTDPQLGSRDALPLSVMRAYQLRRLNVPQSQVDHDAHAVVGYIVDVLNAAGGRRREHRMRSTVSRSPSAQGSTSASRIATAAGADKRKRGQPGAFLCTWCLCDWVQPTSDPLACRRCRISTIQPVCLTCRLATPTRADVHCRRCADAANVARSEIGNPRSNFGTRHHRARKWRP